MSIAFCNVETVCDNLFLFVCLFVCLFVSILLLILQEFQGVDPNFIKLFRIAQLIIEYLLVSNIQHEYCCVLIASFLGYSILSSIWESNQVH